MSIIFIAIAIAAIVLMMVWSSRSQKKRQEQIDKTLDAVQPGNKVKTIGGICGVVVELCPEDNTFILETGSENSGKSYIKFDKKAIYQTDAMAEPAPQESAPQDAAPQDAAPETTESVEEAPFEEAQESENTENKAE